MTVPRTTLHPQLAADCYRLAQTPSGQVLLHRNAVLPWFILAPDTDAQDLLRLPTTQRNSVLADCALLDEYIRTHWQVDKVNFAAIGNLVPQLHLHLVGRRRGDDCWPKPVWGNLQTVSSYTDTEVERIRAGICALWL